MFNSFKYSNLFLRLALAFVFLWFGIDKFFHPAYWLQAWVPQSVVSLALGVGLGANDFIYALGVFEVLVGVSLLSGAFMEIFASLAVVFLVTTLFFHGFNEVMVRDIGLIGALLALVTWPKRRKLFL